MKNNELVSIIIRTCGKPNILNNALKSVVAQTYPNIEVIIIEDGPDISQQFIKETYPSLNYKYYTNGVNLGRTKTGNIGLTMSTGKYVNFLDEDDILLSNHIETLVEALQDTPQYKVAYAIAEEHQIRVKNLEPYTFRVKRKLIRYKYPFNRLLLCYMNLFPIQSVLFERELFTKYGGFDEALDMLEDWDLWVRYSMYSDFLFVPQVTSVYYTPFRSRQKQKREKTMNDALQYVIRKHSEYIITLDAEQINHDMDYILNVFNKKKILFYLQKIRNYLLYQDR